MGKPAILCIMILAVLVAAGCGRTVEKASITPLTVFAGAATQPALDQVAASYMKKTGERLEINYAGAGTLLTQIEAEHAGDLYIPGTDDYATKAVQGKAVDPASVRPVAYLEMVILVAKGNPKHVTGIQSLADPGVRVAIPERGATWLGNAADAMLVQAGIAAKVRARVASYPVTCEAALDALLMGDVDAVIGWDAYARQHPKKVQMIALPKKYQRECYIPGAVITWSKNKPQAKAFLAYLSGPQGKASFKRHGYTVK